MDTKINKMNVYFDRQIASCQTRSQAMAADSRQDEADFEKITSNIYEIFRTMLSVAVSTHRDSADDVCRFFLEKLEHIPSNWSVALEKAKSHDDVEKAHIESLKLSTVEDIRKNFNEIWEENQ